MLGLGAPIGGLLFKMLMIGRTFDPSWFRAEWDANQFFYSYMTVTTPAVFMLFGGFLGGLTDRIQKQQDTLKRIAVNLERQSITDELTGIHNRRFLVQEIEKEVERCLRHKRNLSGMMIDVDNFKSVNDRYGHAAGDQAIREIAELLKKSVRAIDTVGRYGGDEFVILLPEATADGARVVAERILGAVRKYRLMVPRGPVAVTVSIGIISFPSAENLTRAVFFEQIDRSLFQAKSMGKDRVFTASPASAPD